MTPEIKEMIVLAAKAMGWEMVPIVLDGECIALRPKETFGWWNPLTSPADSHTLMCALEIEIGWYPQGQCVEAWVVGLINVQKEPYTTDKSLACRLAILRVAAEIGKRK